MRRKLVEVCKVRQVREQWLHCRVQTLQSSKWLSRFVVRIAMALKPFLKTFLCHLSLRAGSLFTSWLMVAVFLVCALGFGFMTAAWSGAEPELRAIMSTTELESGRNPLLEAVYPLGTSVAAAVFALYALTGLALAHGVKNDFEPFIRLFLASTVVVVLTCIGEEHQEYVTQNGAFDSATWLNITVISFIS